MPRNLLRVLIVVTIVMGTSVFAQDHLLITELVVDPSSSTEVGEFVEIFNPTTETIDLTDYYLTDATFSGGGTFYYQIVEGAGGGGGFGDWHARFPDGATIAPGEFQTMSLPGSIDFMGQYGVAPTYELYEDDGQADSIPDMLEAFTGSINGQGGFSFGEVLILYFWDGESDLVRDVDYVVWQDKVEAVDKTGVRIDGPDAGTDSSMYAPDTPIAEQFVVNVPQNVPPGLPHSAGNSAQRRLEVEDLEDWSASGNGITGHDETGEDTSYKGGIWSIDEPATPGTRALGGTVSIQDGKLMPDSLTIADLQFVRSDSIGTAINDDSPFLGQTISVTGIVMHDARIIDIGNRWGFFVQDERGGPWSGWFVIQNDTISPGAANTLMTAVDTGDKVRFTALITEFPAGTNTASISQHQIDNSVPIELLEAGRPAPAPLLLTPLDLGITTNPNTGNRTQDPQKSERWESVLARFENLIVIQNDGTTGSNTMIVGDGAGNNLILDDYFEAVDNPVTANSGVWPGLPAGSQVNVVGYIRSGTSTGNVTINPATLGDITVVAAPPEISNVERDPVVPTSAAAVSVSATVTDLDGTVAGVNLMYNVDSGALQTVAMTNTAGSTYSGDIPAQADGAFIQYLLEATDNEGNKTTAPGDTMASKFFYSVRDAGITIADVQFVPDGFTSDASGFVGLEVTLTGTVTSIASYFSGTFINTSYYIQDAEDVWSGIQVRDPANDPALGDNVTVTGTVQENFSLTRLNMVTSFTVNSSGNTVAPLVRTTGEMGTGGANPEAFESVLVEVRDLTVSDPMPDSPANFGEFSVTDGSGNLRIDDEAVEAAGNWDQDGTRWTGGESITFVRGIHHFHNGNFKIQPRTTADVGDVAVSVADRGVPLTFDLSPNYPNPFNPATTIRYQLASQGDVAITIFNMLGQKVRTLVDRVQPAGVYSVQWDGTNDRGAPVATGVYFMRMRAVDFVKSQKMLLMK